MAAKKWYENNYRRHLCDMHIDDWNDEFMSKFSAEDYLENLKRAKIKCAMIYYQSHTGLCNYPTKTGKIHNGLVGREDEFKRLTDMCEKEGIDVVGYYSLNYNTWAHDKFPEWRMITASGKSRREREEDKTTVDFAPAKLKRYGLCCPNNDEYMNFVYAQIDEMLEYFKPKALFFDMLHWPHACYCEHCKKRWKEETGLDEMPTVENYDDELWRKFCALRNAWMGEEAQKVTDYIHKKAPHVTVEHNVSGAAQNDYLATATAVNLASEFCGGDLHGDLLQESVTCKLFREITVNQPFEFMFAKCHPGLGRHTLVRTDNHIEAATFLAAAHHGATMIIDAIDPVGTLDRRNYESFGRVFEKLIPYEKYFVGETVADVAVVYGLESKGPKRFGNNSTNHNAAVAFIRNMIEAGIPVDVISKKRDFSKYKMIFAPCLWETESEICESLLEYAKGGGVLYYSGAGNSEFIEKIVGGKIVGMSKGKSVYFAPEKEYEELLLNFNKKYPLPVMDSVPLIELDENCEGRRVIARLTVPYTDPDELKYASIHSNPPGVHLDNPTIIERDFGEGKIIYIAAPIEYESYIVYQNIIRSFIDKYVGMENLTVSTSSPTDVETVVFKDKNDFYVNNVLLLDPKNKPSMPEFEVKLKTGAKPKRVLLLPEEKEIEFEFSNDTVSFTTRKTEIFDMYKIEC